MSSSANLEVLPVELQRGILKRITDMKTLHALIRASPRFFQIYKGSKEAIMSQIVHNQMDPAYLPIAFDVHYLRETNLDSATHELGIKYSNGSGRKSHLCGPRSFSYATSKALISFHETIEYFISDFAQSRLSMIEKCLSFADTQSSSYGSTSKSKSPLVLSEVEHSRLARAFYRFELFTCLFCMQRGPINNVSGAHSIAVYTGRMRLWELEEFYCVWGYFAEKRSVYVDQVERHLSQCHNETNTHASKLLHKQEWVDGNLFLFPSSSSDFTPILHLERSFVLGLKTIRAILNAKSLEDRPDTYTSSYSSQIRWILQMNMRSYYRIRWLPSPKYGDYYFEDVIEKPNNGLLWATKNPNRPVKPAQRAGLRRYGYAIWDHKRLTNLGVLNKE